MQATTTQTRFGALLVALTLSSGAAFAAEQGSLGASSPYRSLQQAGETRTIEGKLVTLFDYLSYSADTLGTTPSPSRSSSSRSGASTPAVPAVDPLAPPAPAPLPGDPGFAPAVQSPGNPANPGNVERSLDQDVNVNVNPGATDATAARAQGQDLSDLSSPLGDTSTRSSGVVGSTPMSGAGGQPLVLIVQSASAERTGSPGGLAVSTTPRADAPQPGRYPTQREILEQGQARERSARTSGAGSTAEPIMEAYLLVSNPQNYASRLALSQAHAITSQSGSAAARTQSDRLPVRGTEDDTTGTGIVSARDSDTWSTRSSMKPGSRVKVVGKVLSRGGLQAIEVMSVEAASQAEQ